MENNFVPSRATYLPPLGALVVVLIGGLMVGLAIAIVGSLFYLLLVFPIIMGVAGGWIVSRAVKWNRIRSTGQVLLLSVLVAVVIYGTYHYGRYIALQLQTWLELSLSTDEEVDLPIAKIFLDYALKEETGHTGFAGYMLYKAKSGISIGRFYSQNRLELTSVLAWLYWMVELGIILWIARGMGQKQAGMPFCESCGGWYSRERHLGGTTPANEPLLLDLLRRNDMTELGRLLEKDAGLPSVELYMNRCEACGKGTSYLTVRRASLGAKGTVQFSDISKATLRPQDSTLFLQGLQYEVN